CAMPTRSRPASTSGMASDWIGVGVWYCSSLRARRIGSARPKSLKDVKIQQVLLRRDTPAGWRARVAGSLWTPRLVWAVNVMEELVRAETLKVSCRRLRAAR